MVRETFEMRLVRRSEINPAVYNPRTIDDDAKKKLRKGMKKFGLVVPLVWNSRTGTLVSGHQRLALLDEENNYPKNDYKINVAAVDLSEKDEATLNIQLNNQSMMGEYDFDALGDLIKSFDLSVDDLNFDAADLDFILGDGEGMKEVTEDAPEVKETKSKLAEIKEARKEMNAKKEAENSASYYFIVVCKDEAERTAMFEKMGVPPSEEFVRSDDLKLLARSRA